ncbi:MAG: sortase [Gaiellales bacterium]|jgi:sortase A|nr:sortase [Gaiellales bacterium]MDX6550595.1 sortase [Gaiellales bacterium]
MAEGTSAKPRGGRRTRRLGNALIALGVVVLMYAGLILAWGDPVTWLWAHWQQRALTSEFHQQEKQFTVTTPPPDSSAAKALVRKDAQAFSHSLKEGHAFGRLSIGRIGLNDVVVVQGTTAGIEADLSKGPGHYMNTPFPGLGGSVAIAGHRTTFGAWFRHIDEVRNGDFIDLQMPYATFHYKVEMHKVVVNTDWSIIKPQGYERLVLSACHPIYSASHRWVVFARAVSVTLPGDGGSYKL